MSFFVRVISCNCVQWAEPRHHHCCGGCGGDHHPRLHGVWLHHWEKVRSRGPHWLSAPVSLRLSITFCHSQASTFEALHTHTLTHAYTSMVLWHAVLIDCVPFSLSTWFSCSHTDVCEIMASLWVTRVWKTPGRLSLSLLPHSSHPCVFLSAWSASAFPGTSTSDYTWHVSFVQLDHPSTRQLAVVGLWVEPSPVPSSCQRKNQTWGLISAAMLQKVSDSDERVGLWS